jgi:hypothetical protein
MTNPKVVFRWLYQRSRQYNLFMLEENEYDDDDNETKDPATVLKQQNYTTWLYIFLLMGK